MDLYIPKDMIRSAIPSERIALIGPPGSGKTTSLLSFPNLIIGDIDKKAPVNVPTIPMWSAEWADSVLSGPSKGRLTKDLPNTRDAIKKWLRENHDKFSSEQTFALDSWSFVQDACDIQTYAEDALAATTTGKENNFFFWGQKLKYSKEIIFYLKRMACRVIVTFHETVDRDEKGNINGKLRPVMDGSYKDMILGAFTNVWRMRANLPELGQDGRPKRDAQGNKIMNSGFFWQLAGDSVVDLNTDPNVGEVIRKEGISKIQIHKDPKTGEISGGYKTLQELYRKHL